MTDHTFVLGIDLNKLEADAEWACEEAIKNMREIDDAVNWADLHCHEARSYKSSDGSVGYSVHIEEASPDASRLLAFLHRRLGERDWPEVEIYLEW